MTTRFPVRDRALAVVAVLGLAAVPATQPASWPARTTAPRRPRRPQRQTYDKITAAFGEGYNAPLSVTADMITSSDPKGTVNDLADAIKKVPGVVAVTQATPNQGGDTALIQVIPPGGPDRAVDRRAGAGARGRRRPRWRRSTTCSDMLVTGPTAINIDVVRPARRRAAAVRRASSSGCR